ncbi:MAG: hypothetical protein WEA09_08955 [Gemmatimonadota bacterium]
MFNSIDPERTSLAGLLLLTTALFGCGGDVSRPGAEVAAHEAQTTAPATVVDSVFPVEEEIRRFQEAYPGEVTELAGGESSRDALVSRFIESLEAADTVDLTRLSMTPREFGYLYYPTSRYTEPPYRLSPALVWYQNQNVTGRGFTRLLRRYGGQEVNYLSYECPEEAEVEGQNRLWHNCRVVHLFEGDTVSIQLFGSIWERGGHYKFVGYANDF